MKLYFFIFFYLFNFLFVAIEEYLSCVAQNKDAWDTKTSLNIVSYFVLKRLLT